MSQLFDDAVLREMQKDDARDLGYNAYRDGFSRDSNPYNNNDEWDLNQAWLDRFMDAQLDD